MNLIVATRHEAHYLRFEVEGCWQHGDALKLAYLIKAAQGRLAVDRFMVNLHRVTRVAGTEEKFLVCDRLLRVFQPPVRVALIGDAALVDSDTAVTVGANVPSIALFLHEREGLAWLVA